MPKASLLLMAPLTLLAHNLMPVPAKVQPGDGRLRIDRNVAFIQLTGYREPRLEAAAARLVEHISRKTGIPMASAIGLHPPAAPLIVYCDHASAPVQSVGEDESYRLTVTAVGARLDAPNPLGVLRGMETFLQLVDLDSTGFGVPAVTIEDHPRYPWRGLMLDVARHWFPVADVKRTLRRHGRREVERLSLAPIRKSRLPHRKQGVSEAAGDGLRRRILYAGSSARRDRIRPRARHSGYPRVRYARPFDGVVRRISRVSFCAGTVSDRAAVGNFRSSHGSLRAKRLINFSTRSSARWPRYFPTSTSISAATK